MTAKDHGVVLRHGDEIRLLPAWPKEWDVDFKLHAPFQTTVQGSLRNGKIIELKVTPESRRADVVLAEQLQANE
jgi:hypothetical protein